VKDGIKAMSVIPTNNIWGIVIYESKPKLADNFQLYQNKIEFQATAAHLVL
jgi:hypothetical protein